jgi:hypothetical protein
VGAGAWRRPLTCRLTYVCSPPAHSTNCATSPSRTRQPPPGSRIAHSRCSVIQRVIVVAGTPVRAAARLHRFPLIHGGSVNRAGVRRALPLGRRFEPDLRSLELL